MIPLLAPRSITLRRYPTGSVGSDGRFAPGTPTDSTIIASVQSADDEVMQILPEDLRRREAKRVYTSTTLHTANQHAGVAGDRLVIDGVVFVVEIVNDYPLPLPHTRAIAVRLQEGQS